MSWSPPGPSPRVDATPVERVLWRVTKGGRVAEARARLMAHGTELRITVGAEVLLTTLYREGEAAKLAETSTGIRQTFVWKEWALEPADESERERH